MMILLILVTGVLAEMIPGALGRDKLFSPANILVGIAGAFTGAFLGFGDFPLFLKYPFLNEKSLMVSGAILFVLIKVSLAGNGALHGRRR
jgi:uncharacterized membrane protein YeaQ/YmgE (transglycosylase-associated protein family)